MATHDPAELGNLDQWLESQLELRCQGCKKTPEELDEYTEAATEEEDMLPDDYVRKYEGTYNPNNGHFLCTDCYIAAGMPSKAWPDRWVCP